MKLKLPKFKAPGKNNFFGDSLNLNSLSGGGNFFENLIMDVVNMGAQQGTFGLLGFGEDGFKSGIATDTAKSGILGGVKEITGAKAAEDANKMARDQFETQQVEMRNQREQALVSTQRSEINKSQMAGAVRSKGITSGTGSKSSGTLGSYERDFLGL